MTLTKQQAERIKKIVNQDSEIRYEYKNTKGNTCALGGLGEAAYIPLPLDDNMQGIDDWDS